MPMPPDCEVSATGALDVVRRAERGAQVLPGRVVAVDVRPEQPHAVLLADRHDLVLQRLFAGLGEARRDQDGVRDALARRPPPARRARTCAGIAKTATSTSPGTSVDRLVRLAAENVVGLGVHRVDLPGEAAVDEVAHHRIADLALLVGGADHRHRTRLHQPPHRRRGSPRGCTAAARAALPSAQQDPDVGGDRARRGVANTGLRSTSAISGKSATSSETRRICSASAVAVRPAAAPRTPAQDLRRPDAVQHRQRLVRGRRRQPEGDVLEHLDQDPAEPERHDLAERRVGRPRRRSPPARPAPSAAPGRRDPRVGVVRLARSSTIARERGPHLGAPTPRRRRTPPASVLCRMSGETIFSDDRAAESGRRSATASSASRPGPRPAR